MFLRDVNALRHHHEAKPTIIIGPSDAQGDCLIVAVTKEPIGQAGQVRLQVSLHTQTFGLFPLRATKGKACDPHADNMITRW